MLQVLVCTELCDFRQLNYISLAMVCLATLVSFLLPRVTNSIYFYTGENKQAH